MKLFHWTTLFCLLLPAVVGCEQSVVSSDKAATGTPVDETNRVAAVDPIDRNSSTKPPADDTPQEGEDDDDPIDDSHGESAAPLTREDIARIKLGRGKGSGTPGDPLQLTYEDLKWEVKAAAHVEMDDVPQSIRDYGGKHVSIRGYMYPSFRQSGLTHFIMLQNDKCKFGTPDAFVYHNIRVTLDKGDTTSLTSFPVTVEGLFKLDPMEGARDATISLFTIDDATVSR